MRSSFWNLGQVRRNWKVPGSPDPMFHAVGSAAPPPPAVASVGAIPLRSGVLFSQAKGTRRVALHERYGIRPRGGGHHCDCDSIRNVMLFTDPSRGLSSC
jgi:hypothetical protein